MVAATGSGLRNARPALSVTLGSRPPSERSGSLLPIADRGIHFAARALRNSPENRHTKLFALLAPASTRSTPTNSGHYDSFRRRLTESLDGVGRLDNVHAQGYWFDYAYEPNSTTDRVKTLTAPFLKQTVYSHEPGRDALISVSKRVGFQLTEEISRFTYTNNKDGQRIARETLREGKDDDGYVDRFLYDPDTGGVIASERDGVDEAYAYDKIGNRLRDEANGSERLYTPNALNQYERAGEHRPSHDVDGNLIAQGERTFTWDGENRLIAIHERGSLVSEYTYDHQSRRIARKTVDGIDERYLYQGWNLIAVYAPGGVQPTETFTWGKDLSGSLQGAGGVGGLLFAKKRDADQDAWLYHYDANGNVTEVTDSLGAVLDSLTYDSFGNLTSVPQLLKNRWRFSTKPYDFESGFYYYGYRYYDAENGRWLSRDPLREEGGLNLYGMLENDLDVLGLQSLVGTEWRKASPKVTNTGETQDGKVTSSFTHETTVEGKVSIESGFKLELEGTVSWTTTVSVETSASIEQTVEAKYERIGQKKKIKTELRKWKVSTYKRLGGIPKCPAGTTQIKSWLGIGWWSGGIYCGFGYVDCGHNGTLEVTATQFAWRPIADGPFKVLRDGEEIGSADSGSWSSMAKQDFRDYVELTFN